MGQTIGDKYTRPLHIYGNNYNYSNFQINTACNVIWANKYKYTECINEVTFKLKNKIPMLCSSIHIVFVKRISFLNSLTNSLCGCRWTVVLNWTYKFILQCMSEYLINLDGQWELCDNLILHREYMFLFVI